MIETLLFVAAINTLPQTWFGTRLPVVMVASYTFLIPAVSVAVSKRMSVLQDPHQVRVSKGFLFHSHGEIRRRRSKRVYLEKD